MKTVVIRSSCFLWIASLVIIFLGLTCDMAFAQATQPIRNQFTTNNAMNSPSDGWIPIWNNTAKKWSNGVNVASSGAIASMSGKGTNTDFYGVLETFGTDLFFGGVAQFTNSVYMYGDLSLPTYPSVADYLDMTFTNFVKTTANLTTVLSNVVNGTYIELQEGAYTVTPSIFNSNLITSTVFQGAKLINKTNITIKGVKGLTIVDGSGGLGEAFVITNCDNITIEGVTFRGYTNHNFMALPPYGGTTNNNSYLWALVNYYACSRLTFRDCIFERSADHGLQDKGAEGTANGVATTILSTNQILIINNTFNDIGGMRTNQAGGLQSDGTAIVCTDARIQGNTFVKCFRGVEPYNEGEASGNSTFANCVIQGNQFINLAESYITLAGSTNGNGIVVDGNYLYREPGFTYHGTNTDNGFGGVKGVGINMNGGDRHVIRGNVVRNMLGIGIAVQTSGANPVEGVSIVGNFIDGVTNSGNQSYGIFLGDPVYSFIFPVRNAYVANNTIRNAKTYAIYGLGLADSTIENNELVNPVFPGAGAAITLQSFSAAVVSNVVVRQNQIKDTGTAEMTYGLEVTSGCLAIQAFDNRIENGTTGTINNGAGTGLMQYDTVSSSTNRLLRAHEVRTQIEAGSNITLATNSSGVVTITGAAGGSGFQTGSFTLTNFALMGITNIVSANANTVITTNSGVLTLTTAPGTGTNFSGMVITNATEYTVLNLGTSTNVTLPWGTTNHVIWSPAAATGAALAMSGTAGGGSGTNDQTIDMTLVWPSGATALTFPTNGPGGSPVFVLTGPSTNRFKFRYDGYRFWISSGQQPSTGTGYTSVMQTNPVVVGLTNLGALTSHQIIYPMHTGSVLGANSNQTIWLGSTNASDLLISTNVTFTNFSGAIAGYSSSFTAFMKVTNAAANVGVNWGNLGGSNPGYGVAIWTNANAPMWTTLTNTKTYVLSVTSRGTNLHPTLTLWE